MKELDYDIVRYKVVRVIEDENKKIIFTTCFKDTAKYNFIYTIGKDIEDFTPEKYGIFCFKKLSQAKKFVIKHNWGIYLTILEVTPLVRSNRKSLKKLKYFQIHPIPEGTIRYNKISVIKEVK